MSTFHYKALNRDSQEISGEMEADSSASVNKAVRNAGFFPTEILDQKAYLARTAPPKPDSSSTAARLSAAARTPIKFNARDPKSNVSAQNRGNPLVGLLSLISVGVGIWFYFGGGLQWQAQRDMSHIEQQVAEDAERQYEIAKRSGSAIDAYVHAGLVAAAYLQAKDETNYQRWKQIEADEGRRAGMPGH